MGRFDALTQLDKKPVIPPSPILQETTPLQKNQEQVETSLLAKKQTSKLAKKQTTELVNLQTSKLANQQGSKILKKFGSYLPAETIKALKRYAFDNDREVYDVLKEAIDLYLAPKSS